MQFYSKVIFWNFCLRKYFLLFFAEFELVMFYNNIVKISEKLNEKHVENLAPSYPRLRGKFHPRYLPVAFAGIYRSGKYYSSGKYWQIPAN